MTLPYIIDLDILPLDLHATFRVNVAVCPAARMVTGRHADARCQNNDTCYIKSVVCNNGLNRKMKYSG